MRRGASDHGALPTRACTRLRRGAPRGQGRGTRSHRREIGRRTRPPPRARRNDRAPAAGRRPRHGHLLLPHQARRPLAHRHHAAGWNCHDAPGISLKQGGEPSTRPTHARRATGSRCFLRVLLETVAGRGGRRHPGHVRHARTRQTPQHRDSHSPPGKWASPIRPSSTGSTPSTWTAPTGYLADKNDEHRAGNRQALSQ